MLNHACSYFICTYWIGIWDRRLKSKCHLHVMYGDDRLILVDKRTSSIFSSLDCQMTQILIWCLGRDPSSFSSPFVSTLCIFIHETVKVWKYRVALYQMFRWHFIVNTISILFFFFPIERRRDAPSWQRNLVYPLSLLVLLLLTVRFAVGQDFIVSYAFKAKFTHCD